jgi:choline dehydrogenase-like flavoprotein
MIEDLDKLEDGRHIDADLCIIGAGAAGLMIARAFLASRLRVVLIESGGWRAEDQTQALSDGEAEPGTFRGLQAGRTRAFGGTTTVWGGQCIRMDPIDFARRAWVPESGWPIDAATLDPYYAAAEENLDITAQDRQECAWRRFKLPAFDFDPDKLKAVHGVFIRNPDLGKRFRAELKAAPNLRVLLHANVVRLGTNAYGTQISEVEIHSLRGRAACVHARRVVLCAGAIENARLLLLSDASNSRGLGNTYDQVGRYLQDHPCGRAAVLSTDHPRVLQDHYNMLYGHGTRYLPKIAISAVAQRAEQVLNCVGRLSYEFDDQSGTRALLGLPAAVKAGEGPAALLARIGRVGRGLPDIADSAWRILVKGLSPAPKPRRILLELFSEQAPDPDSRVTLGAATDALGLRQIRVDWRLDELTGRTLRCFTRLVEEEFARLGLAQLQRASWLDELIPRRPDVLDSYHPAGTTRMGLDPRHAVVDTDCQVFGVHGLYVAGSSVFPTSGAANPTLTVAAIALRVADHIKAEFNRERVERAGAPCRTTPELSALPGD